MPASKKTIRRINRKLNKVKNGIKHSPFGYPVSHEEINLAISTLKPYKACGTDSLFPEFFKNMGDNARRWLGKYLIECYNKAWLPKIWKRSKVKAVLKPGKDKNLVDSYKMLERV